ncbi:dipeptide ABC transporter ATP-binding protein [Lacrimispora amygdalina]|uniref:Dipeptide ABC transporter ATP-binding protein n=1 Tax=Lacrimispora amygdalina TaxID=253257 RepID=A0A3E2N5U1_9FIRM|nr:dipeptide ABC transporter ATP-binding protein [Clostridium indicum]RFZ76369.1 dipeptide ABC transporter ATP-binding protein [Clostridium indicum]
MKMENQVAKQPILEVKHLKKWFSAKTSPFSTKKMFIKAVDDVSFNLYPGETLGVVGESGCGKSTMGRAVLRLIEPTEGEIIFKDSDFMNLKSSELRKRRGKMQIIFQDPYASLNPRMTIGEIIAEPLDIQRNLNKEEIRKRVLETMEVVGLNTKYYNRYPHEFSGGQRQRIGIARAIVIRPELMVCDEPVSALDVSIQAQVINLLKKLQKQMGMAYIFISHDLSVIKHISDRVAVMYLGHIVEIADKEDLYKDTLHPYTKALISAIPVPDRRTKKKKIILDGDLPSPANPPSGCVFHTRCYMAQDICRKESPVFKDFGKGHFCACHFAGDFNKI